MDSGFDRLNGRIDRIVLTLAAGLFAVIATLIACIATLVARGVF